VSTFTQPAECFAGDLTPVKAVKGVADGDKIKGSLAGVERFGSLDDPPDVVDAEQLGLVATEGDRLWLLIDCPHFVEVVPQCEGDLAGSTRQVEQAPATLDAASAE
jgi:hypothetical protein